MMSSHFTHPVRLHPVADRAERLTLMLHGTALALAVAILALAVRSLH